MSTLTRIGAGFAGAMLLLAAFGPSLAPFDPTAWVGSPYQPPSPQHWFGTDDMGHDLWSVWLHGARHSVLMALLAGLGTTVVGTIVGTAAGYAGGRWDYVAARLIDFQLALPTLPLVLVIAFYAGPSSVALIGVLIATLWANCARELRPVAATLKNADFIAAQRAMGAREADTWWRYVLPRMAPLIWAQFARLVHQAVLLESALAFLGLGDPQQPSWGGTLYFANARAAFLGESWLWWVVPPGLAIAALVLGFSLLGGDRTRAARRAASPPAAPAETPARGALLDVRGLTVRLADRPGAVLNELSLTVAPGEVVGIAGLSGAGKSTLAHTLLGLLPSGAGVDAGSVWLEGQELLRLSADARRQVRATRMGWVPQAAMQSLNPVRTIGAQLKEVMRRGGTERRAVVTELAAVLRQVGLEPALARAYPHQLSGGMRQRVVIAMALCRAPRLLVADEPSSGLDRARAHDILAILVRLSRERHIGVLLIAHDLGFLTRHCDVVVVLDEGRIVERAAPAVLCSAPEAAATRALVASASPYRRRRRQRIDETAVLELHDVHFAYATGAAVRDVSLAIRRGECVGLVGASGAGKSTIARLAVGLVRPRQGSVWLLGQDLAQLGRRAFRARRRLVHLIFQDPYTALPPGLSVQRVVAEPLRLAGVAARERRRTAAQALAAVGFTSPALQGARDVDRLSGGQRQRVALARALASRPCLIVADEPTSMLDAVAKRQWLEQLDRACDTHHLAVLLITHDIAQARAFCDRIVVLDGGRVQYTIDCTGDRTGDASAAKSAPRPNPGMA